MNPDFLLADKFAHQLLPQMCLVQTPQFFPNFWNSEPDWYANQLWQRLAQNLQVRGYTNKIIGKKFDPQEGLTIFLIQFPFLSGKDYSIRGAAVFRYSRSGVNFGIQKSYCFTQEKVKGRFVCITWEDSPSQYLATEEVSLFDDSEKSFMEKISSKLLGNKPKEVVNTQADIDQLYSHWLCHLPEEINDEIDSCMDMVVTAYNELVLKIKNECPGFGTNSNQILEKLNDELFKIGAISFIVGYENRTIIPINFLRSKKLEDLPEKISLLLRQALNPLGTLNGQLLDLININCPYQKNILNRRIQEIYTLIEKAEVTCLINGFSTMIM